MEKLFYQDTHMIDFEATVLDCVAAEQPGQYFIVLDRTAFFPEEGGQFADKGTLNGQPVLDVQIKGLQDTVGEELIYHLVDTPIPVGTKVTGHVDWTQRFDFMQQHSGEHIISGLVHKHFGYDNVGFHLGYEEVTLDFNGELTLDQLRAIEAEANETVWKNLPIYTSFPNEEALAKLDYRSKLDLTENVRIVEIPDIDVCACCAPHVDTTAQIGLIKITNVQNHRGGVRVNILCGERAVKDYTTKQDSVSAISVLLSAKPGEVANAVNRLMSENAKQKERTNALQAELLHLQLQTLPDPVSKTAAPDSSNATAQNVLLFVGELDNIAMRNAVNTMTSKYTGYCGLFSGDDQSGYRFIIGSSVLDCRELATRMREVFQAKGGGSVPMIQGTVIATKDALTDFFQN